MKKDLLGFLRGSPLGRLLDLDSLAVLSEKAESCPLQDPFRIRARFLGWKVASLLLDEKGELKRDFLSELIHLLEMGSFPVGQQEGDAWIFSHLLTALQKLAKEEPLWKALKKCSMPLCSKSAEKTIRDTLWPDEVGHLQTAHIRRAVLSSWLTLLRQATGSCFATAPAMLIQQQSPMLLIEDLDALLSSGELRRGDYAAPLHPGSGLGDLQKPIGFLPASLSPGLRAGFHAISLPFPETIDPTASSEKLFEEALLRHFQLTRDDLAQEQSSVAPQFGVLWERVGGHFGGISPKAKQIRDWKQAVERAKQAFLSMADCSLLRSWEYTLASFCDVKVEFARWNLYGSLGLHHDVKPPGIGSVLLRSIQEKLDAVNQRLAQLSGEQQKAIQVVRATERLLQRAINEMQHNKLRTELTAAIYTANNLADQLEAGKPEAQWLSQLFASFLQDLVEKLQLSFQEMFDPAVGEKREHFEDGLAGFRLLYKSGRSAAASWERIENEEQFVNAVYQFFQSLEREFVIDPSMQSSFTSIITELLQYIRSDEFLEGALFRAKERKGANNTKPWAYESGGTMPTLVQSYFQMAEPPREWGRPIQGVEELHSFLREAAQNARKEVFLMYSPTHAFLFYPLWMGLPSEHERGSQFLKQMNLSSQHADFLIDRLAAQIPPDKRQLFHLGCRQQPVREDVASLHATLLAGWLAAKQPHSERVDSFLYESLPLFTSLEAAQALEKMKARFSWKHSVEETVEPLLTARELIERIKDLLFAEVGPFSAIDWDLRIAEEARREGYIYPHPLLFADTNWSDWSFGIVRNFATGEAELWRLSRTGLRGVPMADWKHLFAENGRWSILIDP